MMKSPYDSDEKKEKFERTLQYFIKHPYSASASTELGYKYYHKGYFLEEIKNLIFSDDVSVARGAAAILYEFGCDSAWLDDLKKAYDLHDDQSFKLYLMNCIKHIA